MVHRKFGVITPQLSGVGSLHRNNEESVSTHILSGTTNILRKTVKR